MRNQILQGDVLEVTRTLADESVNCIVTSPPYFGLRDYQLPPTDWPEVSYAPMTGLPEITIPAMTCCLGLEDRIEAYVGHIVLVWREMWRVLRGDGVGWLNLGDSYASQGGPQVDGTMQTKGSQNGAWNGQSRNGNGLPPKNLCGIPWRVTFALQADGWYLRSDIIWHKKNPMPESCQDRPTKAHEYLFLLAKSEKYWYDADAIREPNSDPERTNFAHGGKMDTSRNDTDRLDFGGGNGGRNKRTVWPIATKPYKEAHFAVMPETLVEPCIRAGCPAQVCVECGEPWVRVVEREDYQHRGDYRKHAGGSGHNNPTGTTPGSNTRGMPYRKVLSNTFAPTCQCNAPTRPGIVLDPFFGSGTTAKVAIENGCDWLGIELNPKYIEMAENRIARTQPPLFVI